MPPFKNGLTRPTDPTTTIVNPSASPQPTKVPNPDEVTKFGDAAAAKWQSASWVY
jgi:hypothetical protein